MLAVMRSISHSFLSASEKLVCPRLVSSGKGRCAAAEADSLDDAPGSPMLLASSSREPFVDHPCSFSCSRLCHDTPTHPFAGRRPGAADRSTGLRRQAERTASGGALESGLL